MTRAISIVLIVGIALQTVGCTTWKPLARANEVSEENNQSSMREQALGQLKEGMRVRIGIRQGASTQIKGQVIECVIEKVSPTSMTVTPITFYVRNTERKPLTLAYTDIASIEYRESTGAEIFGAGVATGAVLAYFALWLVLTQY